MIQELVHGALWCELALLGIDDEAALADGLHPSQDGHRQLGERFAAAFLLDR